MRNIALSYVIVHGFALLHYVLEHKFLSFHHHGVHSCTWRLSVTPSDQNYSAASRTRMMLVFVHKQRCVVHLPIAEMYSKLCTDKSSPCLELKDVFFEQSPVALREEMRCNGHTAARGWKGEVCNVNDWRSLLTDSEVLKADYVHFLKDHRLE